MPRSEVFEEIHRIRAEQAAESGCDVNVLVSQMDANLNRLQADGWQGVVRAAGETGKADGLQASPREFVLTGHSLPPPPPGARRSRRGSANQEGSADSTGGFLALRAFPRVNAGLPGAVRGCAAGARPSLITAGPLAKRGRNTQHPRGFDAALRRVQSRVPARVVDCGSESLKFRAWTVDFLGHCSDIAGPRCAQQTCLPEQALAFRSGDRQGLPPDFYAWDTTSKA